jgi:hypothetical protein
MTKLNDKSNYSSENNYGAEYKHLSNEVRLFHNFMIQKYEKGCGKYVYHHDGRVDVEKKGNRVITYLWYLNDVTEGGETEFFGNFKIKPEKGKILLFPANWSFPHRGKQPISSHKYIITGWFYESISLTPVPIESFVDKPETRIVAIESNIIENVYSQQICLWIIKQVEEFNDKIPVMPLVISLFQVINDIVKTKYKIQIVLDIQDWYIDIGAMKDCDLFLAVSLISGHLYINQSCEEKCVVFIVR